MAHATPPSRFGLVYTGHTFMVTELGKSTLFLLPHSLLALLSGRPPPEQRRPLDSHVTAVLSFQRPALQCA